MKTYICISETLAVSYFLATKLPVSINIIYFSKTVIYIYGLIDGELIVHQDQDSIQFEIWNMINNGL